MKMERKLIQGDWGSMWLEREVYKYGSYTPRFEMITERREDWWGTNKAYNHPDSPLEKIEGCSQNPEYIVCPYCGNEHDPETEDYFLEGEEAECYECEKKFITESHFGYGFSTSPKPCKHHHWVFEAQYYYEDEDGNRSTWRNMVCINCGEDNNSKWPINKTVSVNGRFISVKSKQPIFTLLPWLDEYNDPDFFDPDCVLKTGADLTEDYPTPILDFLRNNRVSWTGGYSGYAAKNAIRDHEKEYGEL